MPMETTAKPESESPEFEADQMVRLTRQLWWMPPKGTLQRAYEGYLYFKNGGRGYTMDDVEDMVQARRMAAPSPESVVTLREITPETVNAILALSVADSQKRLVASNERSIAQAHFEPAAWFRAIYADEEPVGFVMLHDETLRAEPREQGYCFLWRFMIDARFQGMGFGWKAMQLVIAHARTRPDVTRLLTSWERGEGSAEGFYVKLGFTPTGVDDEGEMRAFLDL